MTRLTYPELKAQTKAWLENEAHFGLLTEGIIQLTAMLHAVATEVKDAKEAKDAS